MSTTFMSAPKLLFTSESVTEGHPDKLCDQISDAVVDWSISHNPRARVACEAGVKSDDQRDWVAIFGEATPLPPDDVVRELARKVLRRVGYVDRAYGTSHLADIEVRLTGQSTDIARGVDEALEHRRGADEALDRIGAGDQGMMIGFACTETPELMPLPIALAHRICRRLAQARRSGALRYLRPDGKAQVTVEYRFGQPARVDTVVVSTQHEEAAEHADLQRDVIQHVVRAVVPEGMLDEDTRFFVNPTGSFVIGGPRGDSGVTGRKIIVDTYGGMARHGGGAFSGKDPTKVDRSGAYAARHVAKNVVAAGLAERFELQVAYAIGVAHPVSMTIETFGTARVAEDRIVELIRRHFDLRPAAIIRDLGLQRPIYEPTAAYGHFGRTDIDAPWEALNRVDLLRREAALRSPDGLAAVGASSR